MDLPPFISIHLGTIKVIKKNSNCQKRVWPWMHDYSPETCPAQSLVKNVGLSRHAVWLHTVCTVGYYVTLLKIGHFVKIYCWAKHTQKEVKPVLTHFHRSCVGSSRHFHLCKGERRFQQLASSTSAPCASSPSARDWVTPFMGNILGYRNWRLPWEGGDEGKAHSVSKGA